MCGVRSRSVQIDSSSLSLTVRTAHSSWLTKSTEHRLTVTRVGQSPFFPCRLMNSRRALLRPVSVFPSGGMHRASLQFEVSAVCPPLQEGSVQGSTCALPGVFPTCSTGSGAIHPLVEPVAVEEMSYSKAHQICWGNKVYLPRGYGKSPSQHEPDTRPVLFYLV